jgi:hypothetical protein
MRGGQLITDLGRRARQLHYNWIDHAFGRWLAALPPRDRTHVRATLITICDVRAWDILTHELGLSRAETKAALILSVRRALNTRSGADAPLPRFAREQGSWPRAPLCAETACTYDRVSPRESPWPTSARGVDRPRLRVPVPGHACRCTLNSADRAATNRGRAVEEHGGVALQAPLRSPHPLNPAGASPSTS